MPKRLDLKGQKFNRLLAVEFAGHTAKGEAAWLCMCDCGQSKVVSAYAIKKGVIKSCGCLSHEVRRRRKLHGLSRGREYRAYFAARGRCKNETLKHYGAKGVKFRFTSFEQFFAELGPLPTPKHSLDRIDNNGDYEPGNVRWATKEEQGANKANSVLLTHDGRTMSLAQWGRHVGVTGRSIQARLKKGWPLEKALSRKQSN